MDKLYAVKQLARLAGVSVRTLHLYDELGLLKPTLRTEAGYRKYGEAELLRLQQILFYKEMGFALEQIGPILDDPAFDLVDALHQHRVALLQKQQHLGVLLATIDKTIQHLKEKTMLKPEALYEGFEKETATAWRAEAATKYGKEEVARSEQYLASLGKEGFQRLKAEALAIAEQLHALQTKDPASTQVQDCIRQHYQNVRQFWGTSQLADPQAEAYRGLGQLYVADERFTMKDGKPQPEFASFLCKAMDVFASRLA